MALVAACAITPTFLYFLNTTNQDNECIERRRIQTSFSQRVEQASSSTSDRGGFCLRRLDEAKLVPAIST